MLGCFGLLIVATGALAPIIGTDFFPTSDVGILKMHVRAPRGMRLEETEKIVAEVEKAIRQVIPAKELRTINSPSACRSRSISPSCRATTPAA